MSASPIVPATDPLKTYSRLIVLGANVQNSTTFILGKTRVTTRLVHCPKLITRLTLEARTDRQSIPNVANGLAVHCVDLDKRQDINFLGKPARTFMDFESNAPEDATLAQVAGPDAMDGIRDLTVGMATVVNATATGAARERFAIVSLGYVGKELMLDGLAAGNSTSSAGRGNATISVKSNGVWKQSESSAAGCALTAIEAVYPEFISGVRLLFACPADSRGFVLAASSSAPATTAAGGTSSSGDASTTFGFGIAAYAAIAAVVAVVFVILLVAGCIACKRRRYKHKMFEPKTRV